MKLLCQVLFATRIRGNKQLRIVTQNSVRNGLKVNGVNARQVVVEVYKQGSFFAIYSKRCLFWKFRSVKCISSNYENDDMCEWFKPSNQVACNLGPCQEGSADFPDLDTDDEDLLSD